MGAPRLSAFHILQALCVWLILLEDGPQNTRASACRRPCPANSICFNGNTCRCDRGFRSSSGKIIISHGEACEGTEAWGGGGLHGDGMVVGGLSLCSQTIMKDREKRKKKK
ncbi:PREDICTED: CD97 antigen-like [Myotis davidii]|uniref:CD97 antigen-like n=1 Tax=Myotis davidii TaxID=225400 RepID=UPI00076741B4|nr:PREDICTED: CD97 antigen-like [Myotis davidii]